MAQTLVVSESTTQPSSNNVVDNSGLLEAALKETNPKLWADVDGGNSWKVLVRRRGARVRKYRRYNLGDHDANLTTEMRKMLRIEDDDAGLNELNDNYIRIIIDKMAGRLAVDEFTAKSKAKQVWLDDLLIENNFEALFGEISRGAIRDGDSYVLIDPETKAWTAEPAYDGYSGVVAIFDPKTRKAIWAAKMWSTAISSVDTTDADSPPQNVKMKLVVYTPETIFHLEGKEGAQEVAQSTDEKSTKWPLPSLPLIHFVNQKDNYTQLGESEIRSIIPLQNILNRTLHSMVMASELSAFKIYYAIGMEIKKDGIVPGGIINMVLKDEENNIVTEMTPEMTAYMKNVKVGEFKESDISNYTKQIATLVGEISQASQTPIYGQTNQGSLSGSALEQLEIGLVGKVLRFQRDNNGALRELVTLTAQVSNEFKGKNAPEISKVSINWKSPELVNVTVQIAALVKMHETAPGLWADEWYREKIGGLLGMSQKQINEEGVRAEAQKEKMMNEMIGGPGTMQFPQRMRPGQPEVMKANTDENELAVKKELKS